MNHAKKPDVEFLRNTTFTPKLKGLHPGQYNTNDTWNNSPNTESHESKATFTKQIYSPKFDNYFRNDDY